MQLSNKKYTVTAWTGKAFEYYQHTVYHGNSLMMALVSFVKTQFKNVESVSFGIRELTPFNRPY